MFVYVYHGVDANFVEVGGPISVLEVVVFVGSGGLAKLRFLAGDEPLPGLLSGLDIVFDRQVVVLQLILQITEAILVLRFLDIKHFVVGKEPGGR